jgi:hypothetical protein
LVKGLAASRPLNWELFRRRITVLLTAHPAVVFFRGFVQLEVAVRGKGPAALAERLHFLRAIGLKPRAIIKFCRSTPSESMPLIVVATGRLIA